MKIKFLKTILIYERKSYLRKTQRVEDNTRLNTQGGFISVQFQDCWGGIESHTDINFYPGNFFTNLILIQ